MSRTDHRFKGIHLVLAAALISTAIFTVPAPLRAAEGAAATGETGASACPEGSDYNSLVKSAEGGAQAYFATNPTSTATGAYQFLHGTLEELGYIVPGGSKPSAGAGDWSNVTWTGKGGVNSRAEFMASQSAQDQAMNEFTQNNLAQLNYTEGQMVNGIPMTSGGAAFASHMLGAGGFNAWAASGFSASGLDASIAAAHGWTPEQYNDHLMGRVAKGGCFDPADVSASEGSETDLPPVYLMEWKPLYRVPTVRPGLIAVVGPAR